MKSACVGVLSIIELKNARWNTEKWTNCSSADSWGGNVTIASYCFIGWWKSAGDRSVGCVVLVLRNEQCCSSYWCNFEHNSRTRKNGNSITFQQAVNNACVPLLHQVYKPRVLQVKYQSSGFREVSPASQNNVLASICSETGISSRQTLGFKNRWGISSRLTGHFFPPRSHVGPNQPPSRRVPSESDRDRDHSPPSLRLWMSGVYTSTPPTCLHGVYSDSFSQTSAPWSLLDTSKYFPYKIHY